MSAQGAAALADGCEARLAEVERKLTALSNALVLAGQVAGRPDVARAAEAAMRPVLAVVRTEAGQ